MKVWHEGYLSWLLWAALEAQLSHAQFSSYFSGTGGKESLWRSLEDTLCPWHLQRGGRERLWGNGDGYHCPQSFAAGMTLWDSAHPGTLKTLPAAGYTALVLHWQLVVIPLAVVIFPWQHGGSFAHYRQADAELSFTDLEKFKKIWKSQQASDPKLAL